MVQNGAFLLNLESAIQKYLVKTKVGGGRFKERELRPLTKMDKDEQVEEFRRLLSAKD